MAVDYGKARTGLAICDKSEFLASPLCVINEWNRQALIEKISNEAKKSKCELIVVGHPKNMDGSEGESAKNAQLLAQEIEQFCNIPTVLYDERTTTITAHTYLNDTNIRGKKRKQTIDSVAATIILQNYLDYRKNTNNHFQN